MSCLIAIVDDDSHVCEFLAERLQAKGYQTEIFQDALNILVRCRDDEQTKPDVIVMDMELGGMSGFEATSAIKASDSTKHIVIIILSAYIMGRQMGNALSSGADDVCPKPFRIEDLTSKIERNLKKMQKRMSHE